MRAARRGGEPEAVRAGCSARESRIAAGREGREVATVMLSYRERLKLRRSDRCKRREFGALPPPFAGEGWRRGHDRTPPDAWLARVALISASRASPTCVRRGWGERTEPSETKTPHRTRLAMREGADEPLALERHCATQIATADATDVSASSPPPSASASARRRASRWWRPPRTNTPPACGCRAARPSRFP